MIGGARVLDEAAPLLGVKLILTVEPATTEVVACADMEFSTGAAAAKRQGITVIFDRVILIMVERYPPSATSFEKQRGYGIGKISRWQEISEKG